MCPRATPSLSIRAVPATLRHEVSLQVLNQEGASLDLLTCPHLRDLNVMQDSPEPGVFIVGETNSLLVVTLNHQLPADIEAQSGKQAKCRVRLLSCVCEAKEL